MSTEVEAIFKKKGEKKKEEKLSMPHIKGKHNRVSSEKAVISNCSFPYKFPSVPVSDITKHTLIPQAQCTIKTCHLCPLKNSTLASH